MIMKANLQLCYLGNSLFLKKLRIVHVLRLVQSFELLSTSLNLFLILALQGMLTLFNVRWMFYLMYACDTLRYR